MINSCPCCGRSLLRHIRGNEIYWYCSGCRQEMPDCLSQCAIGPQTTGKEELSGLRLESKVAAVSAH